LNKGAIKLCILAIENHYISSRLQIFFTDGWFDDRSLIDIEYITNAMLVSFILRHKNIQDNYPVMR